MGNELVVGVLAAVLRLRDELTPQLRQVSSSIEGFAQTARSSGAAFGESLGTFGAKATQVGGMLTALTLPMAGAGAAAIKLGMDAVESENLFKVSFGNMEQAARQWSMTLSQQLGLNEFELRRTSGVLFTMFNSMGAGRQSAFDMATGITKLSADLASFFNIKPELAFEKLRAGMVGEMEPLRALGILVDETTVKHYAYTHGIAENGAQLTQQEKLLARYGTIMAQTSVAQGDLARTMDSPTNQLRIMSAQMQETATRLGVVLLPVFTQFIGVASALVPHLEAAVRWFTGLPQPVQTTMVVLAALGVALGPVLIVVGQLAIGFSGLIAVFPALATAFGVILPFLGPAGLIAVGVGAVLLAWHKWDAIKGIAQAVYNGIKEWLVDKFNAVVASIKSKVDAVTGFFADMYDKVIGHSYVPDMINGVAAQFQRLPTVMVTPTMSATTQVSNLFDGLFQKMQSKITSILPGLFGGGDGKGGLFGSLMQGGLAALFGPAGPLAGLVSAGISALGNLAMKGLSAMWNGIKGLFASEESKYVNKPRDEFFAQFGGFEGLASTLTNATNGDTAERLIRQLYDADTRSEYTNAVGAINGALGTQSAATGIAAADRSIAIAGGVGGSTNVAAGTFLGLTGTASGGGIMGFAGGTGGRYLDFGTGTLAVLHGRERVMTEDEGQGGLTINVNVNAGTVLGNADEFRTCVTQAVLDGIERGGSAFTKFRILSAQAAH